MGPRLSGAFFLPGPIAVPSTSSGPEDKAGPEGQQLLRIVVPSGFGDDAGHRRVQSLLAGEIMDIDGQTCQARQLPTLGPDRPIDVPVRLAASEPRDAAAACGLEAPGALVTALSSPRCWTSSAGLVVSDNGASR